MVPHRRFPEGLLVEVPGLDELGVGPGQGEGYVGDALPEHGMLAGVLYHEEAVLSEDA